MKTNMSEMCHVIKPLNLAMVEQFRTFIRFH